MSILDISWVIAYTVKDNKAFFFLSLRYFIVLLNFLKLDMPVEIIIGLLNFLTVSKRWKLSKSPEDILKKGTFSLFKNIALSLSNGVDRKSIFNFLQ